MLGLSQIPFWGSINYLRFFFFNFFLYLTHLWPEMMFGMQTCLLIGDAFQTFLATLYTFFNVEQQEITASHTKCNRPNLLKKQLLAPACFQLKNRQFCWEGKRYFSCVRCCVLQHPCTLLLFSDVHGHPTSLFLSMGPTPTHLTFRSTVWAQPKKPKKTMTLFWGKPFCARSVPFLNKRRNKHSIQISSDKRCAQVFVSIDSHQSHQLKRQVRTIAILAWINWRPCSFHINKSISLLLSDSCETCRENYILHLVQQNWMFNQT